jgi:hypothetical protein
MHTHDPIYGSEETNNSNSTPWQTVLLAILVLCLFGTICSLKTKNLHRIILWFAPINSKSHFMKNWTTLIPALVIASVAICVALLILTPNKKSARRLFTEVTDGSGWGSKGFSFLLGYVLLTFGKE